MWDNCTCCLLLWLLHNWGSFEIGFFWEIVYFFFLFARKTKQNQTTPRIRDTQSILQDGDFQVIWGTSSIFNLHSSLVGQKVNTFIPLSLRVLQTEITFHSVDFAILNHILQGVGRVVSGLSSSNLTQLKWYFELGSLIRWKASKASKVLTPNETGFLAIM